MNDGQKRNFNRLCLNTENHAFKNYGENVGLKTELDEFSHNTKMVLVQIKILKATIKIRRNVIP